MIIHPVTCQDIERAFAELQVPPDSVLYVAASLAGLVSLPSPVEDTLRALRHLVGPSGTIVMPSFSWDFCDSGHFDRERTPTHCGLLAEAFRITPGVRRTWSPPYHTVCASGPQAETITSIESRTSFGAVSVFQYLVDHDALVLLIGCGFNDGVAHVHWLEETIGVPYRRHQMYTGTITRNGLTRSMTFQRYVRSDDVRLNAKPIEDALESAGAIRHSAVGLALCSAFSLADFARILTPVFRRHPCIMVEERT